MLISVLREEYLVKAIGAYVREIIGDEFTKPQTSSFKEVFGDINSQTPLVFLLSTGSDPMAALEKFAIEKDFIEKLQTISLGIFDSNHSRHKYSNINCFRSRSRSFCGSFN